MRELERYNSYIELMKEKLKEARSYESMIPYYEKESKMTFQEWCDKNFIKIDLKPSESNEYWQEYW